LTRRSVATKHGAMEFLEFIRGDATAPGGDGNRVIAHVCNDAGGWGKGFVVAISKRWPEPEREYRQWHRAREKNDFALGALQLVSVSPDTWVANMVAQHGVRTSSDGPPIRYEAVEDRLGKLAAEALALKASVHMPRIGCGLAGGKVGTDRAADSRIALRARGPRARLRLRWRTRSGRNGGLAGC
jgi:O-acetyl-ADP-ribose deacetylase (regulator of RNase III)